MGMELKILVIMLGIIFLAAVISLLVIKRINERNSFLWLIGALAILLLSFMPDILERMARATGADYPPTLLFLLSILVILFILLYQSIQISLLQEKCRELSQQQALLDFKHKNRENKAREEIYREEI